MGFHVLRLVSLSALVVAGLARGRPAPGQSAVGGAAGAAREATPRPHSAGPLVLGALVTGKAGTPVSAEVLAHPDIGGFLIHQGWKDIEVAKGVFDWSYLDGEFATAVANNKKTKPALHIGGDDAPKWLYDDGSIPFVLGKSGATFTYTAGLTFSGSTVSIQSPGWPGNLSPGKLIEIVGTPNNDGRYRVTFDTTSSITVEEVFVDEVAVDGTVHIDVVPCYWDAAVIRHKSDFYNALIAHIRSLGPSFLETMLNLGVSMVDPNTGDWSFVSSPDHLVSYGAAGWSSGSDAEKQAGWDRFDAAMKSLYDGVLPNVPGTMLVGSAVGPVPRGLLPSGTDKYQPVRDILAYVEARYPGKLNVAKGALNARTYYANPCPAVGSAWEDICAKPSRNFLQINWSVSSPGVYKANGDHPWDKSNERATATILKNAGLSAHAYGARWFEFWHADVDGAAVKGNPALRAELDVAIAYIKDLFSNGNPVIGAPIPVQVPPPTVTAPAGVKYVLQYVFDYNGEVPSLFEVRRDGLVVGNDLSFTIANPTPADSGLYEVSCGNSAGTTTVSTRITFR